MMATDEYGNYISDNSAGMYNSGIRDSGTIYGNMSYPTMMDNSSYAATDLNQGFGVPNSYGLATQPQGSTAPQNYNVTGYQMQPGGQNWNPATGQYDTGSLESRVAADQAAVQRVLNPSQQGQYYTQNTGPGTPMAGGSRSTVYGARPDVSQIGQPYAGGAGSYLTSAGYKPPGPMPTTLMDQYTKFLTDPQGGLNSPIFQAILDQGQQAAQRGALAAGGNGSPAVAQALQKNAIGLAGSYLPTMADILKGGAQTESGRYGVQANVGQGAGQLGLQQYGAEAGSQLRNAAANYGYGQDQYAQAQAAQAQQPVNQLITMMMQRQMQGY